MPGTYELKRALGTQQFMWNLKAENGETVLTSETYYSKASAESGIASCRQNSPFDVRYERKTSAAGQPYFVLRAANYEVIGTSEMYVLGVARENGIQACKRCGPTAVVTERT